MAKRKPEDPPAGSPAWMTTFSDLMNLLLCFFVMLFSMSSIDATKYSEMAAAMSNSTFSIFNAGSTAIGEGILISNGVSQLNDLDEYISNAGRNADSETDSDNYEKYDSAEALEEEVLTEEAEPYTEPEEVLEVADEVIPEEVSEPVYTEETADIAEVQADDTVYEEQPACAEQPVDAEAAYQEQPADEENQAEADQTEEPAAEEIHEEKHSPFSKLTKLITPKKEKKSSGWPQDFQPIKRREDIDEDLVNGDVNPYTGHEYRTNSVRMHPHRIGYVQVYDRKDHKWTDMTEWAFLGVEERKKATMGKDYEPPIYLD